MRDNDDSGGDSGVPTQVDIKSLEGAVPWLESLKKYVQDNLIRDTANLKLSQNYGPHIFSGVDSAADVWDKKHNAYVEAVKSSYHDVGQALDIAIQATKSIVQNYKDVEHNNAVNVAAVEKAFADGSSGGGSSTPTTATSSSTTSSSSSSSSDSSKDGSW